MAGSDSSPDELDPEAAFMVFSHELRLDILLELWNAPGFSRTFSELRKGVGERDSGRFTYHLDKLTGQFVGDHDDQYVLLYAGHRVIDAIRSGIFHESPSIGPIDLPTGCHECGTRIAFEYSDHLATVRCPECGDKRIEYPFDPGAFQERTVDEAIDAFERQTTSKWRLATSGDCFVCSGPVAAQYTDSVAELDYLDRQGEYFVADHPVLIEADCRNCSFYSYLPVGIRILDDPGAVTTLADFDSEFPERRLWNRSFVYDSDAIRIQQRDPWEIVVSVPTDSGVAEVTLDEALTVSDTTLVE